MADWIDDSINSMNEFRNSYKPKKSEGTIEKENLMDLNSLLKDFWAAIDKYNKAFPYSTLNVSIASYICVKSPLLKGDFYVNEIDYDDYECNKSMWITYDVGRECYRIYFSIIIQNCPGRYDSHTYFTTEYVYFNIQDFKNLSYDFLIESIRWLSKSYSYGDDTNFIKNWLNELASKSSQHLSIQEQKKKQEENSRIQKLQKEKEQEELYNKKRMALWGKIVPRNGIIIIIPYMIVAWILNALFSGFPNIYFFLIFIATIIAVFLIWMASHSDVGTQSKEFEYLIQHKKKV